jgi:hypothetical protein
MHPSQGNFIVNKGKQKVNPLTLNLNVSIDDNGKITGELRKVFFITDINKKFWVNFFATSLSGVPIKAEVVIEFRDPFLAATRLKQMGLLKPRTVIKEKD